MGVSLIGASIARFPLILILIIRLCNRCSLARFMIQLWISRLSWAADGCSPIVSRKKASQIHARLMSFLLCGAHPATRGRLRELFMKKALTRFLETNIYDVLCVRFWGGGQGSSLQSLIR